MYEWESFKGGTPSIGRLIEERGSPVRRSIWYFTEITVNYLNGNLIIMIINIMIIMIINIMIIMIIIWI